MLLEDFASLVEEALESLPEEFLERLENVQVDIEEWPTRTDLEAAGLHSRSKYSLLGLYHGVPLTDRGAYYVPYPIASPFIRSRSKLWSVATPSGSGIR